MEEKENEERKGTAEKEKNKKKKNGFIEVNRGKHCKKNTRIRK